MAGRKTKRRNAVRHKSAPPRVQRAKRPSNGRMVNIDPFVHCVMGPLDMPGSSTGVPDGSNEPSVVIEHRQTIVLTPNSTYKEIAFALVSSPCGALGIGAGSYTADVQTVTSATSYGPTETLNISAIQGSMSMETPGGAHNGYFPILPFSEHIKEDSGYWKQWAGSTGMQPTKFRVVTTQANVTYTGSSMMNSGVAATGRIAHHLYDNVSKPFATLSADGYMNKSLDRGTRVLQRPPRSFSEVASLPGARIFPARMSAMMINSPNSFDYQDIREGWCPFWSPGADTVESDTVFASIVGYAPSSGSDPEPCSGPSIGVGYAPVSYYWAKGLDTTATVTVCIRTCVEYTLSFNAPSARFAKTPPPERPLAIQHVREMGRTLPSSAPLTDETAKHGWLYNAASWYGTTMKNIIGTSWKVGGRLMSTLGGGQAGGAMGQLTQRTGQLMIGN